MIYSIIVLYISHIVPSYSLALYVRFIARLQLGFPLMDMKRTSAVLKVDLK